MYNVHYCIMYVKSIFHCSRSNLWFTLPCNVTFYLTKSASPRTSSLFVFLSMITTITVFIAHQRYHCHYQCSGYHHYSIVIAKVVVVVIGKMEIALMTEKCPWTAQHREQNADTILIQSRGDWRKWQKFFTKLAAFLKSWIPIPLLA